MDKVSLGNKIKEARLKKGVTQLWELSEHFGVTEDFMKKALKHYNLWNGD